MSKQILGHFSSQIPWDVAVEDVSVDGGAEEAHVDHNHRRLLVHAHQQGEPRVGGKKGTLTGFDTV